MWLLPTQTKAVFIIRSEDSNTREGGEMSWAVGGGSFFASLTFGAEKV